jgi:uncharacterized membrane protein YphA (DoxX/SURF4 family)
MSLPESQEEKMLMFDSLRKTSHDRLGGVLRIFIGLIFIMAGLLKVIVPSLGEAFSGQLVAANIPLHGFVRFTFPVIEMLLGILLLVGFHARISASVAAASMVVATYVHIAIDDPSLFPLQPVEPIGPLVLLAVLIYTLIRGGGAWSMDLKVFVQG